MYYRVEWTEDGKGDFFRTYKARDFRELWRLVSRMNFERKYSNRPIMQQIRISAHEKYDGEFFEITSNYDANMATDAERNGQ